MHVKSRKYHVFAILQKNNPFEVTNMHGAEHKGKDEMK